MMRIQGVVAPPSTWKDAEVYEVGTVITGNTPPKRDSLNYGEYIPFVKPPQLLNTTVDQSADNAIIDTQLRRADALRQSILKKAFSGELVEQGPNDEPATVLLERIKAEKASQKPRAKTRQRKVANA